MLDLQESEKSTNPSNKINIVHRRMQDFCFGGGGHPANATQPCISGAHV